MRTLRSIRWHRGPAGAGEDTEGQAVMNSLHVRGTFTGKGYKT